MKPNTPFLSIDGQPKIAIDFNDNLKIRRCVLFIPVLLMKYPKDLAWPTVIQSTLIVITKQYSIKPFINDDGNISDEIIISANLNISVSNYDNRPDNEIYIGSGMSRYIVQNPSNIRAELEKVFTPTVLKDIEEVVHAYTQFIQQQPIPNNIQL